MAAYLQCFIEHDRFPQDLYVTAMDPKPGCVLSYPVKGLVDRLILGFTVYDRCCSCTKGHQTVKGKHTCHKFYYVDVLITKYSSNA